MCARDGVHRYNQQLAHSGQRLVLTGPAHMNERTRDYVIFIHARAAVEKILSMCSWRIRHGRVQHKEF